MARVHDDIRVSVYSREDSASRRVAFVRQIEDETFTVSVSVPDGRFISERFNTEDECHEFSDKLLNGDFPIKSELKENEDMAENMTPVNGEVFYQGFQWIADQLNTGDEYHFALLGSGSANVYFENVVVSNDFDVIDIDHDFLDEKIKRAIQGYAEANGMGRDWINDSIAVYGTASEHRSGMYQVEETIEFFGANGGYISVEMPTPEFVLYRKMNVGRNKDFVSAVPLGAALGLYTTDDFLDFILNFRPELRYYYEQGRYNWEPIAAKLQLAIDGMLNED